METDDLFGHFLGLKTPSLGSLGVAASAAEDNKSVGSSDTTTEKKLRRRLQNRRAAKVSRARKKAYISLLESKAADLQAQVKRLLAKNSQLEARVSALESNTGNEISTEDSAVPEQDLFFATEAKSSPQPIRRGKKKAKSSPQPIRRGKKKNHRYSPYSAAVNEDADDNPMQDTKDQLKITMDIPRVPSANADSSPSSPSCTSASPPLSPLIGPLFDNLSNGLSIGDSDLASSAERNEYPQQLGSLLMHSTHETSVQDPAQRATGTLVIIQILFITQALAGMFLSTFDNAPFRPCSSKCHSLEKKNRPTWRYQTHYHPSPHMMWLPSNGRAGWEGRGSLMVGSEACY